MFSNKGKLLSICTMVLPWLTAPLLGKATFKRFTPIAVVTNVLWSIMSIYAKNQNWWKANPFILKKTKIDIPFVTGLFFVTTLWVFKLSFGNFKKYFALNAIFDLLLAFPIVWFYEKMGAFKLRGLKSTYFYLIILSLAVVIYGIQTMFENVTENKLSRRVE